VEHRTRFCQAGRFPEAGETAARELEGKAVLQEARRRVGEVRELAHVGVGVRNADFIGLRVSFAIFDDCLASGLVNGHCEVVLE
jgi:hypothetical protein